MPDPGPVGVHHVAYVCKDIDATHHFYEDLMGFKLVHTEVEQFENGGYFRHDPNGIMVEFCRDTPGITPDPQAHDLFTATTRHAAEKKITT